MKLADAKRKFVNLWGTVGVEWGINRTMAQLHGLLLTSAESLSTEEVMEALQISRGNANTNLRELVRWGLVHRETKPGDRKEYFAAEKDIWEVAQRIVAERRKRELDPLVKVLEQLRSEATATKDQAAELDEFQRLLGDLTTLATRSSQLLDLVARLDQSAFFKPLLALLRK